MFVFTLHYIFVIIFTSYEPSFPVINLMNRYEFNRISWWTNSWKCISRVFIYGTWYMRMWSLETEHKLKHEPIAIINWILLPCRWLWDNRYFPTHPCLNAPISRICALSRIIAKRMRKQKFSSLPSNIVRRRSGIENQLKLELCIHQNGKWTYRVQVVDFLLM